MCQNTYCKYRASTYSINWSSMNPSKMVQDCIRNDIILSSSLSSPIWSLLSEIFSRNVSISVLVLSFFILKSILASTVANHAAARGVMCMYIVMISVVWRLIFIPFCKVRLAVTIMCRRLCSALIVVTLIIILGGSA